MAQLHYEAYRAPQHTGTQQAPGFQRGPEYQQDPAFPPPPVSASSHAGRFVSLIGALVSVALVAGVGIWSYRLMVRDVSGVPVIRALAGPYRVTPDDPGGLQASYQGLSVNTVAAVGNAADASQTIALAPPPVQLSAEDRAVAALIAGNAQPITAPTSLAPTGGALIDVPNVGTPQALALDLVPASRPGISSSRFPRARPGGSVQIADAAAAIVAPAVNVSSGSDAQAEAVLQDLVTRLAPSQVNDIDPNTLAPGTRLVQLGAYDSDIDARAAWDNLAARFPAYLENRGRIIESASAGGRTFYRLRAHGFSDEPEARRFCSVFLADNADCIPVLIR